MLYVFTETGIAIITSAVVLTFVCGYFLLGKRPAKAIPENETEQSHRKRMWMKDTFEKELQHQFSKNKEKELRDVSPLGLNRNAHNAKNFSFSTPIDINSKPEPNSKPHQPEQENLSYTNTAAEQNIRWALHLLGIDEDDLIEGKITATDISRAYKQKSFEYHPDKVSSKTPVEQAKAHEMMSDLNEAKQLLFKYIYPDD